MASRLRPTPETGRVAATQQPASAIGPSWAQRGSREARLAFRQAQRRGDREGAMRVAMEADKAGLASQASIGSAEERMAGDFQGRQKDTAVTAEIETALTPPGLSRGMIDTPAGPRRAPVAGGLQEQAATATQPPIPEPPAAPGASQPPENPVTGEATPETGDAQSRLGSRRINPLTGKPLGYDPRNPSPVDVMSRVRELTSAEGGDMMRGAAVRQANSERVAAGQTPVDIEQTLDDLQAGDRETEATRRTASALNRGPTLSPDPVLARSFRTPTRQAPAPPAAAGPAATPASPLTTRAQSPAYRLGQVARELSPGSIAGRAAAANRDIQRGTALDIASTAAAPLVEARNRVADFAGERVLAGIRRRRRLADFIRGVRTPQS